MNIKALLKGKESRNALWLIGGKVAQMVLSVFVGILSARYLGPSNSGLIGYGNAFTAFFMSLCTLGINSIIVKEFIDNPDEQGETIGTTLVLRLLSSLCSSVLVISASFLLDYGEWDTVIVVALCSLSLLFHVLDTIQYWFQAQYKSHVTAIALLVAYIATSAYKVLLLILGKSVFWFAVATSLDYLVLGVLLYIFYKCHHGPRFRFSWRKGRDLLSKSYHYILSGLMVAVYAQTDKLMLKQMMDEASVGYFTTAVSLCSMWTFVLSAIIDAMTPTIVRAHESDPADFDRKNKQLYAIIFYLSALASVFFLIFGDLAVRILYGEEFMGAAAPLKVLTWYTAFSYFGVARNPWVVCKGKQRYLKYIYVAAAIINVFLNIYFIPALGVVGAATASLVTQILTSIIIPCFIKELRPNVKLIIEAICLKGVLRNERPTSD